MCLCRRWDNPSKSEIAQLEFVGHSVDKQILGLDVPMNHTVKVAPVNRTAQLVNIATSRGETIQRCARSWICSINSNDRVEFRCGS